MVFCGRSGNLSERILGADPDVVTHVLGEQSRQRLEHPLGGDRQLGDADADGVVDGVGDRAEDRLGGSKSPPSAGRGPGVPLPPITDDLEGGPVKGVAGVELAALAIIFGEGEGSGQEVELGRTQSVVGGRAGA